MGRMWKPMHWHKHMGQFLFFWLKNTPQPPPCPLQVHRSRHRQYTPHVLVVTRPVLANQTQCAQEKPHHSPIQAAGPKNSSSSAGTQVFGLRRAIVRLVSLRRIDWSGQKP